MKYEVIIEGKQPPFLIPLCASCNVPVERFTVYDPVTDPSGGAMFAAEAECHGKTTGVYVKQTEMARLSAENKMLVLFKRRLGFDSVR